MVQFQLPPGIASADLTSNHGTVDILADKVSFFGKPIVVNWLILRILNWGMGACTELCRYDEVLFVCPLE